MKLLEAKEILGEIFTFYPNFNRKNLDSPEKASNFTRIWLGKLTEGDYEGTKQKLSEHILNSQYPPSIAEILVIKPEVDESDPFEKDREAVARELADPAAARLRQAKLKELKEKMGGLSDG